LEVNQLNKQVDSIMDKQPAKLRTLPQEPSSPAKVPAKPQPEPTKKPATITPTPTT